MVCNKKEVKCGDFMNESYTYVYVAEIPFGEPENVYPKERQTEIGLTKNEKLRKEKYYVWRLLEHAIADKYGICASELEFTKHSGGWWSTPSFEFSLSHTDGIVAVAISNESVGVDVEVIKPRRSEKTAERIMSADEYNQYLQLRGEDREVFFLSVWTAKEAVFKSLHKDIFLPSCDYSDADVFIHTERITVGNNLRAVISVAHKSESKKILIINL